MEKSYKNKNFLLHVMISTDVLLSYQLWSLQKYKSKKCMIYHVFNLISQVKE